MVKLALGAGAGAVVTRGLTQIVLKHRNEGVTGYAANVGVSIGLAFLGGKFLGNEVGAAVLAGGLAATVQRIWDEKVSMVAQAAVAAATGSQPATVKGLGDVSYSDDGLGRIGALGEYVNADFPMTRERGAYGAPALPAASAAAPMPASGADPHQAAW